MTDSTDKPTPDSPSAASPPGHSGGASWTAEMEATDAKAGPAAGGVPPGVPIDTAPRQPTDAGPNHGNYKGG